MHAQNGNSSQFITLVSMHKHHAISTDFTKQHLIDVMIQSNLTVKLIGFCLKEIKIIT